MDQIYVKELMESLTYNPHTGLLFWVKRKQGRSLDKPVGVMNTQGYLTVQLGKKKFLAHRVAFLLMGEPLPKVVDHINGVKDDNRWCNLRPATVSQNIFNSGLWSSNTSGYRGVSWDKSKNKWESYITYKGKHIHLGRYDCPIEAHKARKKASKKYFGDFYNGDF